MNFNEKLNEYIGKLKCTAKELSEASGLSEATLSRYRSGERVPEAESKAFDSLCCAVSELAEKRNESGITKQSVAEDFLGCSDMITVDREKLRNNFNTLIELLNINITRLCKKTNYDVSTIFRIRNGSRQVSDPMNFAAAVARYVSNEANVKWDSAVMEELLGCTAEELSDTSVRCEKIRSWLLEGRCGQDDSVCGFLKNLNEFDLNEFIKAIHFDEMKVPTLPFQLPTSKTYFGLKQMMESELDFLKATVLSKSMESVIMYSDMPMEEMAKDPEFPKKWMFGMAMMLKKGLHLNHIHCIDRSFTDMMLGLQSFIPMYMTGQISPYYLKGPQNNVFLHFLKVSGSAALSGEAINGHHSDGKYYLTKNKDEVAYYRKRAEELLGKAYPLMDIYREERSGELNAFLLSDSKTEGKRRNILSALPIYTADSGFLEKFLESRSVSEKTRKSILDYADLSRKRVEKILEQNVVEDEVPDITREEFERFPMILPLSEIFYEKDIAYTYEDYLEHMKQTEKFAESHPGYTLKKVSAYTFRNLQITIHEGKWAMVSKVKSPAIHFVIHHPKLRNAIENFIPPVNED